MLLILLNILIKPLNPISFHILLSLMSLSNIDNFENGNSNIALFIVSSLVFESLFFESNVLSSLNENDSCLFVFSLFFESYIYVYCVCIFLNIATWINVFNNI